MRGKSKIITALIVLLAAAQNPNLAQSPDDRYPIVREGKVGFIDYRGREVIAPRFNAVADMAHFKDGLAPVYEPGRGFGYIDPSGSFVIGPTNELGWGRPFNEGIASIMIVGKNFDYNKPAWIDRKGQIVFTGMGTEGAYFSNGLMPMRNHDIGMYGFVNKNFEYVIPPQYDLTVGFSEGRAPVCLNSQWGFIDVTGKVVVPFKYSYVSQFEDGLARVSVHIPVGTVMTFEGEQRQYQEQYGFIDHEGNEVIGLQFKEATNFSEGYALAMPADSGLWGIIDKRGKFVHKPEFEYAAEFHEGLALAWINEKYGYIDRSGKWVIPPTFIHADSFSRGLARVAWKQGVNGYIDKRGKAVWKNVQEDR
jgi:hypothetical protein